MRSRRDETIQWVLAQPAKTVFRADDAAAEIGVSVRTFYRTANLIRERGDALLIAEAGVGFMRVNPRPMEDADDYGSEGIST